MPHVPHRRVPDDQPRMAGSVMLYDTHPGLGATPDILAGLSPQEIDQVFAAGYLIRHEPGEYVFRQGEPHRGIFILREGVVRSFYQAPSGREITLANWTPGNFVGGPEIFSVGAHVWSGVAVTAVEAVRLPGGQIRQLMAQIPAFAVGLVEGLSYKGKCYSALLQMLGTRSGLERLASVLLNLAERSVAARPLPPHEQLATMIGATRQWVSMTLDRFRVQGLIEIRHRHIVILRAADLRALADGERLPARRFAVASEYPGDTR